MNSIANPIRQKANYEKICEIKSQVNLFSPREDNNGNMFVASHAGEILSFNEGGVIEPFIPINGQPNSMIYDSKNNLYIADVSNASVLVRYADEKQSEPEILVKDYENAMFKGPTSLAFNSSENILYFADAGQFGFTNLNKPQGSVFLVELGTYNILRPLLINCLAYPADLVYDNLRGTLYVVETFANRVIRFTQKPIGVYHASVFHKFSGRIGPTAITIDEFGNIYVARFEFQNTDSDIDGLISVINPEGVLIGEISLPKMPEITGIYISPKKKDVLYVTEKISNGILRIKLSSFLEKLEDVKLIF